MSKTRAELIKRDGKWGAYLWLTDSRGNESRTIVAMGNTADEARTNALSFSETQHKLAQARLIRAQSDSVACREMVEAFEVLPLPDVKPLPVESRTLTLVRPMLDVGIEAEINRLNELTAAYHPGPKRPTVWPRCANCGQIAQEHDDPEDGPIGDRCVYTVPEGWSVPLLTFRR